MKPSKSQQRVEQLKAEVASLPVGSALHTAAMADLQAAIKAEKRNAVDTAESPTKREQGLA